MYKKMIKAAAYTTASVVIPAIFVVSATKQPPLGRENWTKFKKVFAEDLRRFSNGCRRLSEQLLTHAENLDQ